ncbi:retrovirus-related pol polyprotein from transposon 412-like protein [Plakobranchus ocellatus]|uniref:Retrovirus-related pol polyprotein from transposon 412-like protein n=1 Tax=Plakobranchus ocellatus TaxID=259542 RepID=A0AAV3Y8X7_9GAST|nr:retrovirus-related pol polyprotein from transposon 412-like protein [Plakobranchus ocellatus]
MDVKKYIGSCHLCQIHAPRPPKLPIEEMEAISKPFEGVEIDIGGPLPMTRNKNQYIHRVQPLQSSVRAPAPTFQKAMRKAVGHLPHVASYFDDILIHSASWEDHLLDLEATLQALRKSLSVIPLSNSWDTSLKKELSDQTRQRQKILNI